MARKAGTKNSAPFNVANLSVAPAALPARSRVAGPSRYADNPMVATLRESFSEFQAWHEKGAPEDMTDRGGRSVTVAAKNVKNVTGYLRAAAQDLNSEGIGLRVVYQWDGGDGTDYQTAVLKDVPVDETNVTILFTAKNARNMSRGNDDENDGENVQDTPPDF